MQLRLLWRIIRLTPVFLLVACLLSSASGFGQAPLPTATTESPSIGVSGTIFNSDREPLEGVSVAVKGTKIATSTNSKGEFFLQTCLTTRCLFLLGQTLKHLKQNLRAEKIDLTVSVKVSQLADVRL